MKASSYLGQPSSKRSTTVSKHLDLEGVGAQLFGLIPETPSESVRLIKKIRRSEANAKKILEVSPRIQTATPPTGTFEGAILGSGARPDDLPGKLTPLPSLFLSSIAVTQAQTFRRFWLTSGWHWWNSFDWLRRWAFFEPIFFLKKRF